MECREHCGACCIAPSITSLNKPAGVRCVYLSDDMRCKIFGMPERPKACAAFLPEPSICGDNREQAINIIQTLEAITADDNP